VNCAPPYNGPVAAPGTRFAVAKVGGAAADTIPTPLNTISDETSVDNIIVKPNNKIYGNSGE
jgi:hypothetical protein